MIEVQNYDFERPGVLQEFAMMLGYLTRIIDNFVLVAAYLLTYDSSVWLGQQQKIAECAIALLVANLTAPFFRFSRSWRIIRLRHEILPLINFFSLSFGLIMAAYWMVGLLPVSQAELWIPAAAKWYGLGLSLSVVLRFSLRMCLRYMRALGFDGRPAAFIGATAAARLLHEKFRQHVWMGISVVGVFDDREGGNREPGYDPELPLAGSIDDLLKRVRQGEVANIYITLPMSAEGRVKEIVQRFADTTASIYYSPPLSEFGLLGARWDEVYGQPVISLVESPFVGYSRALKRLEDILLLAIFLPITLPIMAVVAIGVKLTSKGPALYRQNRLGVDGKPFEVYKFRTMHVRESDQAFVQATRGDPRITRFGAFLRRTSLDELPQIFNVLNGSMSVVGPRPHPIKLNEDFRGLVPRYMVRHKVKPGITGLAQVNGARGETDTFEKMERRVDYDLAYIRQWSLALDLRIIARTVLLPIMDRRAF